MPLAERVQAKAQERRWLILFVLCFSLIVIVLDNSILNVALPTILRTPHASNSQLPWMVGSYTLGFARLLLTMGSVGGKYGRRPALPPRFVGFGVLAGIYLIPNSKDPRAPRLDLVGAGLSIIGLSALLYAVIEAPTKGWTAGPTLTFFALGGAVMAAFFLWERRVEHPMLDMGFWKNPRFSGASGAIAITFFAMFGSIFLLTQYLQFVLGYTPLQTGIRLLAFAVPMMVIAPFSPKVVDRIGTKLTVALGLACVAAGLVLLRGVRAPPRYAHLPGRLA